jgi:hypothetical protein
MGRTTYSGQIVTSKNNSGSLKKNSRSIQGLFIKDAIMTSLQPVFSAGNNTVALNIDSVNSMPVTLQSSVSGCNPKVHQADHYTSLCGGEKH